MDQDTLIKAALQHIPFEGWTQTALAQAEIANGLPPRTFAAYFPGGIQEFIAAYHAFMDTHMAGVLARQAGFSTLKVREKIQACVMARLTLQLPYREAVRRLLAHQLLPWNQAAGLKNLARVADAMWRLAGDRSTDYNYYTKRLLLGQLYARTLPVWLADDSADLQQTAAYVAQRVAGVMRLGKKMRGLRTCHTATSS